MYLFAYGTLMSYYSKMKHFSPNAFLVGKYTLGDHALYSLGWFPGIKPMLGSETHGEVWYVPEQDISKLDQYESVGLMYTRTVVGVYNEKPLQTYVYNHKVSERQRVSSGSWMGR